MPEPGSASSREAILEGLDSAEAVAQLVTDAVTGLEGFIPGGRVARSVLAYAERHGAKMMSAPAIRDFSISASSVRG